MRTSWCQILPSEHVQLSLAQNQNSSQSRCIGVKHRRLMKVLIFALSKPFCLQSNQGAHLQATAHHPPTHEALRSAHDEQQAKALCEGAIYKPARQEVEGGPRKHEAQHATPHAVRVLHPVDELELFKIHAPDTAVSQNQLTAPYRLSASICCSIESMPA